MNENAHVMKLIDYCSGNPMPFGNQKGKEVFPQLKAVILGECQLDLVLKYLPLIIFIYPVLSWLDGRKRFSHNAKFCKRKYFTLGKNVSRKERNLFISF